MDTLAASAASAGGTRTGIIRAAAYCRVSTARETQEGSFEFQKAYYENLIKNTPGMELVKIYGDRGRSGTEIYSRPGLQSLMTDCEAGKIDIVLCKSISRLSRSMGQCVALVRRLSALGVTLKFEKEGLSTDKMAGEILLCILGALAEEESNSLSKNLRLANRRRLLAGVPATRAPYGYRKDNGVWRIEPHEAGQVRRAFLMACRGHSLMNIVRALQQTEDQTGTGRQWTWTSVHYLLRNERYRGDILTDKKVTTRGRDGRKHYVTNRGLEDQYYLERHHEPIIGGRTFEIVQVLIQKRLLHKSGARRQDHALLEQAARIASEDKLLQAGLD